MPELPEVHTTVTGLQQKIVGATIVDIWSNSFSLSPLNKHNHKSRDYFSHLQKELPGEKIADVSRRGKHILIHLFNQKTIVIHMKMTGHLIVGTYKKVNEKSSEWPWVPEEMGGAKNDPFNRHVRFVFTLQKGAKNFHLVFCDARKFGTIELFSANDLHKKLSKLGPEPLSPLFSLELFIERLQKKKETPLKQVLMNQEVIVGVGNIYSDEALFLAHLHPLRTPSSLSPKELKLLYTSVISVLTSGIAFGGDSMSDYRNTDGARGEFQGKHSVYLRTGKPCLTPSCSGIITKKTIGGRSAHFCPVCQK